MLALVTHRPAGHRVGTETLAELPDPPAPRWSGFLVVVSELITLSGVVAWALEMRSVRPMVPISIIGNVRRDQRQLLAALDRVGLHFNAVHDSGEITDNELATALDILREASVEREILQKWLVRWQPGAHSLEAVLAQIISHGVRGGRAKSLRVVGPDREIRDSTLTRLLKKAGLPGPGYLVREARLDGVALRAARGVTTDRAASAAGFSSPRAKGAEASLLMNNPQGSCILTKFAW
jgi:hypothetical protein